MEPATSFAPSSPTPHVPSRHWRVRRSCWGSKAEEDKCFVAQAFLRAAKGLCAPLVLVQLSEASRRNYGLKKRVITRSGKFPRSTSVRKSMVLNSRSIAGGPQIRPEISK